MLVSGVIAFIVSLFAVLFLMPYLIDYLKGLSFNQNVSEYSLQEYKEKAKTPIMGGILFIAVPTIVSFIAELFFGFSLETLVLQLAFVGYGAIGFIDDWLIVVRHNNEGLRPLYKFLLQVLLALVIFFIYRSSVGNLSIRIPFTTISIGFGFFYAIIILLMFAGSSNAVNLTDGMDGLAAGCSVCSFTVFLILAVLAKKPVMVVFLSSLLGSLFGYLHYNVKPAKIFMGDTGSLALGGALAACAMILKQEIPLIMIGMVFVLDTLSCMIQIGSVKLRHKRVFPYTPIHYSFVLPKEKGGLGLGEVQTVHIIWLAAAVFALLGLIIALH